MWEYSDEKLEDWILATKGETVIFDHLGPVPEVHGMAVDDDKIYRLYDPTTRILYFRGSGFNLQALADAIADVYKRVIPIHRQLLPDQYTDATSAEEDSTAQKESSGAEMPADSNASETSVDSTTPEVDQGDQPGKPKKTAKKKNKTKKQTKKASTKKKPTKTSKRGTPKSSGVK